MFDKEIMVCHHCGYEGTSETNKCPICGVEFGKSKRNFTFNQEEEPDEERLYTDIEKTCDFFLQCGTNAKAFSVIIAAIVFYIGYRFAIKLEDTIVMIGILPIVAFVIYNGFVVEKQLKWKSYMLYTNYLLLRNQNK